MIVKHEKKTPPDGMCSGDIKPGTLFLWEGEYVLRVAEDSMESDGSDVHGVFVGDGDPFFEEETGCYPLEAQIIVDGEKQ